MSIEGSNRYPFGQLKFVAAAALAAGTVMQAADGRAMVIQGGMAVAAGQEACGVTTDIHDLAKSTSVEFTRGDQVWWDATNNVATTFGQGDFYVGVCAKAAGASATGVYVDLNVHQQPAISLKRGDPFTTEATEGLGVVNDGYGTSTLAFDATAEVAQAALYSTAGVDIDNGPVLEAWVAIYDIGDNAALDINVGLASASHATDFEAIAVFAAFQLDGAALAINTHSDDGTTDRAPAASGVSAVDDTYLHLKIDCTDKSNVKFYINGVRVNSGTTYDLSAYSGSLKLIAHMEKTSNDTTADLRVQDLWVTERNRAA